MSILSSSRASSISLVEKPLSAGFGQQALLQLVAGRADDLDPDHVFAGEFGMGGPQPASDLVRLPQGERTAARADTDGEIVMNRVYPNLL